MRKLFLSLFAIACALASCNKQDRPEPEEVEPFLTVKQTGFTCKSTESMIRVEVESNVDWDISFQEDPNPWIEFGKTDWGVMVWVEENASFGRGKYFKIISEDGTMEYTLSVFQSQPDDFTPWSGENTNLSVTPNTLHFPWDGGTKTVEVNSTTLWRVLENEISILQPTLSPLSGIGKVTLTITAPKLERFSTTRATQAEKTIKIISGSWMVELKITQGDASPSIE